MNLKLRFLVSISSDILSKKKLELIKSKLITNVSKTVLQNSSVCHVLPRGTFLQPNLHINYLLVPVQGQANNNVDRYAIHAVLEFRFECRLILQLTLGMLSFVQMPSESSLSRISHAKMDGHSLLNWAILLTTSGVATRGLLPPIARGLIEPVS